MAEQTFVRKVTVRPESPLKLIQPTSRPKAKVNSSAQVRKTAPSRPGTSQGSTPRAVSPAKFISSRPPPPRVKSANSLSPTFQPKLRVTPTTPEGRGRAHTSASSDVGRVTPAASRVRHGSVSLHHAVSFSSLIPSARSSSPLHQSDTEQTGRYSPSPPVRIKSKVTNLKSNTLSPISPSQPPFPLARSHRRVASTSSTISNTTSPPNLQPSQSKQSPPTLYPITTASPAANPHRYITRSPPQAHSHQYYQPLQTDPTVPVRQNGSGGLHKTDQPTTVPLSPQNPNSPPASALSFSSRSSVSRSSVSASLTAGSSESVPASVAQGNSQVLTSMPSYPETDQTDDKERMRDDDSNGDGDGELRTVKAEAKSNRKIADLEITNRSLLSINASLESAKHRQAKEIRELRRKLRESRLILPPRAYRAVLEQKDASDNSLDVASASEEEEEGEEEGDETYERVKVLLEELLESGKRALESKPADLVEGGAKVTVLSADEVRSWQDSAGEAAGGSKEELTLSPSLVALPDDRPNPDFDSEDEVEESLIMPSSPRSTFAPPILVTDSY